MVLSGISTKSASPKRKIHPNWPSVPISVRKASVFDSSVLIKNQSKASVLIRSDEGLTLETSAFRISVRWPIYIINSVDKTKFLFLNLVLRENKQ